MTTGPSADERALLVALQNDFPLIARPFVEIGERLGRTEADVIAQVSALKAGGTLRQIGAIFDTRRLGYSSMLVACEVEPAHLDEIAAAVSAHRGVSHNYARDHWLNLWFTLATPPGVSLEIEATGLTQRPGVVRTFLLPTNRTFKIDVRFDFGLGGGDVQAVPSDRDHGAPFDADGIPFVRALQEDLPLVTEPFAALAGSFALSESELLGSARRFLAAGTIRRYGATLRHRQAGYAANAMVCWDVPEAEVESAGQAAAEHSAVSHCYERPAFPPDWPYRLFSMTHSRTETELASAIEELRGRIRPRGMAALRTVREYKKVRLRYFE